MKDVCDKTVASAADSQKRMGAMRELVRSAVACNVQLKKKCGALMSDMEKVSAEFVGRLTFGHMEMKCFSSKLDEMTRDGNALSSKTEKFGLEMQCMPSLVNEARKLRRGFTELQNTRSAKGSTLPAMRLKRKRVDLDANARRARVELLYRCDRVEQSEARVRELEKCLGQGERNELVAMSRYALLCGEHTKLKEPLQKGILCNGKIRQRVLKPKKDVVALVDGLQNEAIKSGV